MLRKALSKVDEHSQGVPKNICLGCYLLHFCHFGLMAWLWNPSGKSEHTHLGLSECGNITQDLMLNTSFEAHTHRGTSTHIDGNLKKDVITCLEF